MLERLTQAQTALDDLVRARAPGQAPGSPPRSASSRRLSPATIEQGQSLEVTAGQPDAWQQPAFRIIRQTPSRPS